MLFQSAGRQSSNYANDIRFNRTNYIKSNNNFNIYIKKLIYKFTSDDKSLNYPFSLTIINILEDGRSDLMRMPLLIIGIPYQSPFSSTYLKIKKLPYGCISKIITHK